MGRGWQINAAKFVEHYGIQPSTPRRYPARWDDEAGAVVFMLDG